MTWYYIRSFIKSKEWAANLLLLVQGVSLRKRYKFAFSIDNKLHLKKPTKLQGTKLCTLTSQLLAQNYLSYRSHYLKAANRLTDYTLVSALLEKEKIKKFAAHLSEFKDIGKGGFFTFYLFLKLRKKIIRPLFCHVR